MCSSDLETRVYDLRDLLAMAAPDVPQSARPRPTGATNPSPPSAPQSVAPPSEAGIGAQATAPPAGGGNLRPGGMFSGSSQKQPPQTELGRRTDDLIELITSTVKPDSWDDVGGPGAIDAYNGLFVVSQTAKVHEQVEHVFDMLRKAAGLQATKGEKVVR